MTENGHELEMQDSVSDILAHLKSMDPAQARVYLETLKIDSKERMKQHQAKTFAEAMSIDDLTREVQQLINAGDKDSLRVYSDVLRTKLQEASQPKPLTEREQEIVSQVNSKRDELTMELAFLNRNPSQNMAKIREINAQLKALPQEG